MKKNLKTGLRIIILIFIFIFIIHWLFFGYRRYIFPIEIGKIELNYDIRHSESTFTDWAPISALELLDQIEQEQSYVNIEELEQLKESIERIDVGYIIISGRCPLRYIVHYKGQPLIGILMGEYSMGYFGSFGRYGEDNGNVLYFYRVRQEIGWPYDGNI